MRIKTLLILLAALFSSQLSAQPEAFFTVDVSEGCAPLTVIFSPQNDPSIVEYIWDMGDGSITSVSVPFDHIFTDDGEFNVCLTVADSDGLSDTYCEVITASAGPADVVATGGELSCSNPQVTLQGSTSTNNVTYSWTGPENFQSTDQTVPTNIPGTYFLAVTDAFGCTVQVETEVTAALDYILLSGEVTNANDCYLASGSIDLTVTGGAPPYEYLWSHAFTAEDPFDLIAAQYDVTVVDVNDCSQTASFTVLTEELLSVDVASAIDVFCNGNSDGAIELIVTGGTPPYNYNWSDGLPSVDTQTGLTAGSYTVTVQDAEECSTEETILINEPTAIQLSVTTGSASCATPCDGFIDLTVTGGTSPYFYEWSNGVNTEDVQELCFGEIYWVTVTDVNGCVVTQSFEITGPDAIVIDALVTTCPTSSGGAAVDVSVSGGVPPYTYQWNNGVITEDQSGITAGLYILTVTDAVDCSAVINVEVGDLINGFTGGNTTYCDGEIVQLEVDAPTAVLYSWAPSTGLSCTDCPNPTLQVDLAGPTTYSVSVEDSEGCFDVGTLVFEVQSYLDFNLLQFSNSPVTAGGTIIFDCNINNPNQVTWTGPNGFSSNQCQPEIANASPADGGIYTLTVEDEFGCIANAEAEVVVFGIIESTTPDITICQNETTTLEVVAPTAVSIEWTPTAGLSCINCFTVEATPTETTTYTATVTDGSGATESVNITVVVEDVMLILQPNVSVCPEEQVTICPTVSPLAGIFTWTGPNGYANTTECIDLEFPFDPAGCYELTYTTAYGCTAQAEVCIEVLDFDMEVSSDIDTLCVTDPIGATLNVDPQGGSGNYSIAWSPESSLSCTDCPSPTALPLETTEYAVTVVDAASGCVRVGSVLIHVDENCVWPGDTDTNKVVNNFDLLNIGLAFDATGLARANASLAWVAQRADDWGLDIDGVDYKHIDTNGDGTINSNDTLAITLNWGETHPFAPEEEEEFAFTALTTTAPFYVDVDTLVAGEIVNLPVILGEMDNPAEDVYGLAFTLEYDSTVVVPGSAYVDFGSSWIGEDNVDMLSIQRTFVSPGQVDIGITRIDGANMSGFGEIAQFYITIEDDILFRGNENDSRNAGEAIFNISNVRIINADAEVIEVTAMPTVATIEPLVSIHEPVWAKALKLQPQPADDFLELQLPENIKLASIDFYSLTGKWMQKVSLNNNRLSTAHLHPGMYLLKIMATNGDQVTRRIIVQH